VWEFQKTEVPILHKPKFCGSGNLRDRRFHGLLATAYGLGIVTACISPQGLTLFIAAVIMVALGILVLRC